MKNILKITFFIEILRFIERLHVLQLLIDINEFSISCIISFEELNILS